MYTLRSRDVGETGESLPEDDETVAVAVASPNTTTTTTSDNNNNNFNAEIIDDSISTDIDDSLLNPLGFKVHLPGNPASTYGQDLEESPDSSSQTPLIQECLHELEEIQDAEIETADVPAVKETSKKKKNKSSSKKLSKRKGKTKDMLRNLEQAMVEMKETQSTMVDILKDVVRENIELKESLTKIDLAETLSSINSSLTRVNIPEALTQIKTTLS